MNNFREVVTEPCVSLLQTSDTIRPGQQDNSSDFRNTGTPHLFSKTPELTDFNPDDIDVPKCVIENMGMIKPFWSNGKNPRRLRQFLLEIEVKVKPALPRHIRTHPQLCDVVLGKVVLAKLRGEALKYTSLSEGFSFENLSRSLKERFEVHLSSFAIKKILHNLRQRKNQSVRSLVLDVYHWVKRYVESSEREGIVQSPHDWVVIKDFLTRTTFESALDHDIFKELGYEKGQLNFEDLVKKANDVEFRLAEIASRKIRQKKSSTRMAGVPSKQHQKMKTESKSTPMMSPVLPKMGHQCLNNVQGKGRWGNKKTVRKPSTPVNQSSHVATPNLRNTLQSPKPTKSSKCFRVQSAQTISSVVTNVSTVRNYPSKFMKDFDPTVPPPSFKVRSETPLQIFDVTRPPPKIVKSARVNTPPTVIDNKNGTDLIIPNIDFTVPPPKMCTTASTEIHDNSGKNLVVFSKQSSERNLEVALRDDMSPLVTTQSDDLTVQISEFSQILQKPAKREKTLNKLDWLKLAYLAAVLVLYKLQSETKPDSHKRLAENQIIMRTIFV